MPGPGQEPTQTCRRERRGSHGILRSTGHLRLPHLRAQCRRPAHGLHDGHGGPCRPHQGSGRALRAVLSGPCSLVLQFLGPGPGRVGTGEELPEPVSLRGLTPRVRASHERPASPLTERVSTLLPSQGSPKWGRSQAPAAASTTVLPRTRCWRCPLCGSDHSSQPWRQRCPSVPRGGVYRASAVQAPRAEEADRVPLLTGLCESCPARRLQRASSCACTAGQGCGLGPLGPTLCDHRAPLGADSDEDEVISGFPRGLLCLWQVGTG